MKKFGLGLLALAVFAVMGTTGGCAKKSAGLFITNAYAQAPVPTVAPAKKVEVKLATAKGTITAVDVKAGTFTLKEANATANAAAVETTFKASTKLIKALKVGKNVVVGYKTLASGENEAVYVKKVTVKK